MPQRYIIAEHRPRELDPVLGVIAAAAPDCAVAAWCARFGDAPQDHYAHALEEPPEGELQLLCDAAMPFPILHVRGESRAYCSVRTAGDAILCYFADPGRGLIAPGAQEVVPPADEWLPEYGAVFQASTAAELLSQLAQLSQSEPWVREMCSVLRTAQDPSSGRPVEPLESRNGWLP